MDLALRSLLPSPPRLLFLSSIGLFYSESLFPLFPLSPLTHSMSIDRTSAGPAPEKPIRDGEQVVGTGYSGMYLSFSLISYI